MFQVERLGRESTFNIGLPDQTGSVLASECADSSTLTGQKPNERPRMVSPVVRILSRSFARYTSSLGDRHSHSWRARSNRARRGPDGGSTKACTV
jgi:hypothetical protein